MEREELDKTLGLCKKKERYEIMVCHKILTLELIYKAKCLVAQWKKSGEYTLT